ncbi:MAG: AzlC family ABC transporter permease [Synergistaceae bacterium]
MNDLNKNTFLIKEFINGVKVGTPIAIGYIPGAAAFGILAKTASLTLWESLFMSAVVFAGASQFVAINLYLAGSALPEIVFATAMINLRHIMLSSSLSKRIKSKIPLLKKFWIFFQLTDESFSVASMQKEESLSANFVIGVNFPGHFTWIFGSYLGWWGTSFLPHTIQLCMGIAIYALFLALLVPAAKASKAALIVTLSAMSISAVIKWTPLSTFFNKGIGIMISATIGASVGAYFFPINKEVKHYE